MSTPSVSTCHPAYRYNGIRVRGHNVIAQFAREGIPTRRPSRSLAKSRLPFVRACLADAMEGKTPRCLAELPTEGYLAARKLARNFIIVEGAYALMCQGRFTSFRQDAVLSGLRRFRRWRPLLDRSELVLKDPYRARRRPTQLMKELQPFVEWVIDVVEKA